MPAGYFREQNGVSVYGKFDGFTYLSATSANAQLQQLGSMSVSGICTNTDFLIIETKGAKSTTSGTFSIILFLGPNASSATDEQIGFFQSTNTTQTVIPLYRTIRLNGTQSIVYGATQSTIIDSRVYPEVLNFDLSTQSTVYYLSVWGQSGIGNTLSCEYISVSVLPGVTQSL